MNYLKLSKIKKLYFDCAEIARALAISNASAKVTANRYAKNGLLLRIKRNLYVLRERWDSAQEKDKFILANLLQVPSYISLMTALSYYEVTTQLQRDFIESIALKRTKEIAAGETVFNFTRIDKKLYFGFAKISDFFIASPEKAFLDALYLKSLKRYSFDISSLDLKKLEFKKLKAIAQNFPMATRKEMRKIWKS